MTIASVGRWVCLVCMAGNLGLVPVDLYFGEPMLALLAILLGSVCGMVAFAWKDVMQP